MNSPVPRLPTPCAGVMPLTPAIEAKLRADVVREVVSWHGTPYRNWGATKGVAVDCAMLLVRAYVDAGVFQEFDPRPYPPDWMTHKDDERYLEWMRSLALEIESPLPGDIAIFRFQRCMSHSGLMIGGTRLVHAFAPWRACSFGDLSEPWLAEFHPGMERPKKFFSVFEKLKAAA